MKDSFISVFQKRAILVNVSLTSPYGTSDKGRESERIDSFEELSQLSYTVGAIVVGKVVQKRPAPDSAYYIGRGKADEMSYLIKEKKPDYIIFNNDLSPAQVRNLESVLQTRVIDRTELILAIFGIHARTKQAKLQLELAQLEYALPRLKHLWSHLSRLAGGVRGARGPGEKQLEVDRRLAFNRITNLKKELKRIQIRRKQEVSSRSDNFTVALVGYTNAGKSTLMNTITNLKQLTEDKLFSTLDTKTNIWELSNGQRVLLSDTVGFIRNLPSNLLSSFHATLEEVRQADLLLHIVDASSPDAEEQISAVNSVLKEIQCDNKEIIIILNKIDLADSLELQLLQREFPAGCPISALKRTGLQELENRIDDIMSRRQRELTVKIPVENGRLMAYLYERAVILSKSSDDSSFKVRVRLGYRDLQKAKELGLKVR
ncbi:MAG: GTPase HflX [Planctomycetota bacterium]|nr:GTPase HflX [Planctomycetota bacterium]